MESSKLNCLPEVRIYGVKIYQGGKNTYQFIVRHSGHFKLSDYEELDLEIKSARLVKRK